MIRSVVLAVSSLLLSSVAVCQSQACPEAETMQSLLSKVRQLRRDLQTVSVAARKAQILIYSFTGCTYRKRSFNTFQKI
jgi:hypothetical protein